MGARYTREDAEAAFLRLCKLTGNRPAESYDDKGAWYLDHARGGYRVEKFEGSGGVSLPFGFDRRNAERFCDAVYFAHRTIWEMENSNA